MDTLSLLIGIVGSAASVYTLYSSLNVPFWISISIGVIFLVAIVFIYIQYKKRRARKYAAVLIGLEWIRLLFEARDEHRLRVSYFEIIRNRMKNVARVPFGTDKTNETFAKSEGFAGACWKEYCQSGERILIVSDLPSVRENQEELLERYHHYNAYINEDKALRFKPDVRSYIIIALQKSNLDRDLMGFVCLDSNAPYEFEAREKAPSEEHRILNEKVKNVSAIVDIISRALYT